MLSEMFSDNRSQITAQPALHTASAARCYCPVEATQLIRSHVTPPVCVTLLASRFLQRSAPDLTGLRHSSSSLLGCLLFFDKALLALGNVTITDITHTHTHTHTHAARSTYTHTHTQTHTPQHILHQLHQTSPLSFTSCRSLLVHRLCHPPPHPIPSAPLPPRHHSPDRIQENSHLLQASRQAPWHTLLPRRHHSRIGWLASSGYGSGDIWYIEFVW